MSMWNDVTVKFNAALPLIGTLAVGLVAGPIISNAMGWQVTGRTARALAHDGVVEQRALQCEQRARAGNVDFSKITWTEQWELAKASSVGIPGSGPDDAEMTLVCARRLSP